MKSIIMPIVGKPNVGKSTLLNALLGEKVSIVTPKPHTTRTMILGSKKDGASNLLFVDTPGVGRVKTSLGKVIYRSMKEYISNLDEMILVLDAKRGLPEEFEECVPKSIVVINKIDLIRKPQLLLLLDMVSQFSPQAVFLISAKSMDGVADLAKYLKDKGQEIEQPEEEEVQIERNIAVYASECVREKILNTMDQEIPYKVFIEPEKIEIPAGTGKWEIRLKIIVPKESYKPILIGRGGQQLKAIGEAARLELISYFKRPGYLGLRVCVDSNIWQKTSTYSKLGWELD